ncbi:hypothetical protein [Micromonospora sp. NPDC023814]|uniref:hypothetical protein n=1 Tax=Micromonospora sp. NPDC023814 TaxID=3154596 RepID=UPI0033C91AAE
MTATAIRPDTCTAAKHGTASAYTAHRCRCPEAREAWRLYNKRRREGRNPIHLVVSIGPTRRIRALVALGWNFRELARRAGYSRRTVQDVAYARRAVITVHTARWVSDLYERLSGTPGGSKYALVVAARYGWAPPAAWDNIDDPNEQPNLGGENDDLVDEVAVRRALEGERIRLTDAERVHAFRVGLACGLPASRIANRLHLSGSHGRRIVRELETQAA